jgi:hypothetical protein
VVGGRSPVRRAVAFGHTEAEANRKETRRPSYSRKPACPILCRGPFTGSEPHSRRRRDEETKGGEHEERQGAGRGESC